MNEIHFSIVIPTYNRSGLLRNAIESVVRQNYQNWELLVCDDASVDDTGDVVASFHDDRIKYFKLQQNLGNAGARNLGVQKSSNSWIAFLDSDDTFEVDFLSEFSREIIQNPSVKFFFCGYRVVLGNRLKKEVIWNPKSSIRGSFLSELKIGIGCGVVVHRSVFTEIGFFDERLRASVDTDFLIRLESKYAFKPVNKVLITINDHSGPRVRQYSDKMKEAYELMIDKHFEAIQNDNRLFKRWYYKLMWLQFHAGDLSGGNNTYVHLKTKRLISPKIKFIHFLFNFFPRRIAIAIHKKASL